MKTFLELVSKWQFKGDTLTYNLSKNQASGVFGFEKQSVAFHFDKTNTNIERLGVINRATREAEEVQEPSFEKLEALFERDTDGVERKKYVYQDSDLMMWKIAFNLLKELEQTDVEVRLTWGDNCMKVWFDHEGVRACICMRPVRTTGGELVCSYDLLGYRNTHSLKDQEKGFCYNVTVEVYGLIKKLETMGLNTFAKGKVRN